MSKARELADIISAGSVLADGAVSLSEVSGGTNNGVVYVDNTGTTVNGVNLTFDGTTLTSNNITATGTVTIPDNAISGDKVEGGTINAVTINTLSGNVNVTGTVTADGLLVGYTSTAGYKMTVGGGGLHINGSNHGSMSSGQQGFTIDYASGVTTLRGRSNSSTTRGQIAFNIIESDNGNDLEAMRITNAGLVGIGLTSPQTRLDIAGALRFTPNSADTNYSADIFASYDSAHPFQINVKNNGTSQEIMGVYANGGGGNERVVFPTGNVGIGVSLPSQKLTVNGGLASIGPISALTASSAFLDYNTSLNIARFAAVGNTTGTAAPIVLSQYSSNGSVGRDAVTIDSSGNLLVGKATTASENVGVMAFSTGRIFGTANSDDVLLLRRNTTDGDIATFRKDGTTVGSIGSEGGDALYIQSGTTTGTGLLFTSSGTTIRPARNGATVDATLDLGSGTRRFKDLYLSGTAYINGIAIGRGAGAVATNTAVGASVMSANTGANNSAFGNGTLNSNISGADNTGLGRATLATNTTGQNNTASGSLSMLLNLSGNFNTAYGAQSLYSNSTASNNTAVGYQAGYSNTTGTPNVAIGSGSLSSNTNGGSNVANGYWALQQNTTGSYNTGIGRSALQLNTTASNNTAVGYQAGYSNTGGTGIVAVGWKALYGNTTGTNLVAVGGNALTSNTIGDRNVAVGYNSLDANSSGGSNTAVGDESLGANTTGNHNTAVGTFALNSSTASNNTAVGYQAGYVTTAADNTFIGRAAGLSDTTGNTNLFLGSGSGGLITTGSKNSILGGYNGNGSGLDIRTASNYIVLSDGDGTVGLSTTFNSSIALSGAVPQSGTGITFPASQNASSNANTLDDYEEGTWTPTLSFSGSSTGITYGNRKAQYVKIGRNVYVNLYLYVNNKGSATGQAQIGGFPFTSQSAIDFFIPLGVRGSLNSGGEQVSLYSAGGNTTIFTMYKSNLTGGTNSALTDTAFSNSTELNFNFWYQATD